MKPPLSRSRHLLALLTVLAAIPACTVVLRAQTTASAYKVENGAPAGSADPAFLARANASVVRARKLIDVFFEQTSNVVCSESVSQTIIGKNGKPLYREESTFEYQLQSNSRAGSLKLAESREARKTAFRDPNKPLLITNGFASLLLVLHPDYEASYAFEPVDEETIEGRILAKVHFRPLPASSSPAAIQLRGRNYPLALQGDIWIDEESGAIARLNSSLDGNLDDLGLHDIRSEIRYSVVQFHDPEESYWMPASAVIDVETPKQHWRNVHRFTDYRRFRATIQVNLGEKQP